MPARAQPPPSHIELRLIYERGPGATSCPEENELRSHVAALMGYDPFTASTGAAVLARITRRGPTLVALMEHRDADGRVRWSRPGLTDPDCHRLVSAMGLIIVGQIDPILQGPPPAAPPPPPTPAPVPAPLPAPAVAMATPPPPVPTPPPAPPKRNVGLLFGVDAVFNPLVAPSASLGVAPSARVRFRDPALSFELGLRAMWSVKETVASNSRPYRWTYTSGVLAASLHKSIFFGGLVFEAGALIPRADRAVRGTLAPLFVTAGLHGGVEGTVGDLLTLRILVDGELVALGASLREVKVSNRDLWVMPPFVVTLAAGVGFALR